MPTMQQTAAPGDVVEVSGRRLGDGARVGEILEVRGAPERPHYLVRWEDGHETVLYPGEGTSIRPGTGPRKEALRPTLDLAAATAELVKILHEAGVDFELLPHRRTTSAAGEARALGILPQTVAKTLIARSEAGTHWRVVVPASMHVDFVKLAEVVGSDVRMLTEEELVAAYPQFELGAVPPFGGPGGDKVLVDRRVVEADHVVFDGGVHDTSLRLGSHDLAKVAEAEIVEISRM